MPFTLHQKLRVAIKMTFISAKTHVGCDTLIPIKTFLNPPKKKIYIYIQQISKISTKLHSVGNQTKKFPNLFFEEKLLFPTHFGGNLWPDNQQINTWNLCTIYTGSNKDSIHKIYIYHNHHIPHIIGEGSKSVILKFTQKEIEFWWRKCYLLSSPMYREIRQSQIQRWATKNKQPLYSIS